MVYLEKQTSKMDEDFITIIGGGLAGAEASWQILKYGGKVRLFEMKPEKFSPAHRNQNLAELVCSNSFKSTSLENASGLLKTEMKLFGSLVMESAEKFPVPAGQALAVDREKFSEYITEKLISHPNLELIRQEVTKIPESGIVIIASGPLTSSALTKELERITGQKGLYFYDALAPIVYKDSINFEIAFFQSRYGKGGDDYINCPMDKEQYERFCQELVRAEVVPLREFEEPRYFEACLPIEEMARRGKDTLRFGPLKPVGIKDPKTGKEPYAVVQLRQEDLARSLYGMVGFQTRLKYPEQERVFRMIPGLERAEFARLGSMHRNTYLNSPRLLNPDLSLKKDERIFFAGQITGVEGYLESSACGIMAGIYALLRLKNKKPRLLDNRSIIGALIHYVTSFRQGEFQPMNANFGLLRELDFPVRKKERRKKLVERALKTVEEYLAQIQKELTE